MPYDMWLISSLNYSASFKNRKVEIIMYSALISFSRGGAIKV